MIDWNVVGPYLIGGLVTLIGGWIGAYLSYRKDSKTIIEEADDRAFKRIEASAERLEAEIEKLRENLNAETQRRVKESEAWAEERRVLSGKLGEATGEITRLTGELQMSREETRELNEVIVVLRQKSERYEQQLNALEKEAAASRIRIRDLEEENHRLKNGSPKGKL